MSQLPLVTIQVCIVTQLPAAHRVAHAKRRIVAHPAPYRSLYRCPYCDTNAAPSHDTIFVLRHSALARPLAHACWAVSRALRAVLWRMLGRVVAEHWLYRGPSPVRPFLLCHDTVYYIMTQNSKWALDKPVACNVFFFSHHFFFSFQLLENHQKNIYIYIFFNFQYKKINS